MLAGLSFSLFSSHRAHHPAVPFLIQGISSIESDHVKTRRQPSRFINYLQSINLTASDLNLNLTTDSSTESSPNIGLAFSGGGYRAMISGGGGLTATDGRSTESSYAGTAGIGDIVSYMAGLSGGSWMVGSYLANNNASIPYLAANVRVKILQST